MLAEREIKHVPVTNNGKLVGSLGRMEILAALANRNR